MKAAEEILRDLGVAELPFIVVLIKIDATLVGLPGEGALTMRC